ncbi:hypothetical protein HMPREF0860_2388 [Treponema socranskii subsp. socranskii VPI DR56BR1116 = ATCC 35536]|uniref:Uncharacterized protein n=1 Tax=Treponema socranskii subsp. socranskii VPI DR56BR1116 = ATCC 35536 TaxID=1125725 RepID=A0ABN0P3W0_TRESO|nr:hypothetical protein HMPREF0860_2388 [Treponema socranskii subsp. socranskii VPI DR56BR1116 = ATCC 35536]
MFAVFGRAAAGSAADFHVTRYFAENKIFGAPANPYFVYDFVALFCAIR